MGRRLLTVALALAVVVPTGRPARAKTRTAVAPGSNYADALAEGDARAQAGDDAAAIDSWRSAYAAAGDDAVGRRDALARIGAAHQRRFGAEGDTAELRRAEASLGDAAALCDGPAADDVACASIRADLEQVRSRLAAVDRPTQSTAPVPAAMQPGTGMVVNPAPPSPEAIDRSERMKSAENVAIAGYVFAGLGGATLVLVSMPALIAGAVAEDRAEDDPFLVSEEELYERRDRRWRVARISAMVGGGSLLFGGIFIATGLGIRHKIKKEAAVARAAPWLGPDGGGISLVGRF